MTRLRNLAGGRRDLSGAGLLSIAMLASGVLAYAFHISAARNLDSEQFGRIAVLWAAMFLAATILFRPLEQTLTRSLVDRRERGEDVSVVLHSVVKVAGVLIAGVLIIGTLSSGVIADTLFDGDRVMAAMLIAGIALFSLVHIGRGVLCGFGLFQPYAQSLIYDGVVRILIALPLLFIASEHLAGLAVIAAGAIGIALPVFRRRSDVRAGLMLGTGSEFPVRSAVAFAIPASLIAAADQVLVNGGPLLVSVEGGHGAAKAAGLVFAATMLVRAPVYVFQGVGASLLQNLTRLHATGDTARFRRALAVGVSVMLAGSALTILFAVAIGPEALRAVFGPTFTADRFQLSILAIGVGLYLGGSVISQGLLAANRGAVACIGWIVALAVFLCVYAVSSGDPLSRISVAFLASAATNLAFGLGALAWTTGLGLFPARVEASALAAPSPVEHP